MTQQFELAAAYRSLSSEQCLEKGLIELKLDVSSQQVTKLHDFVALMMKWNRTYNLTAVRDKPSMVVRHILDSLSVLKHINGARILDVGTGPGLPGIPLALLCPEKEFVLLDSNGKKTRFIVQALAELGLDNVIVANERVEHFQPTALFDVIISRAFSDLTAMVGLVGHLCQASENTKGQLLAMKGKMPEQELAQLPEGFENAEVRTLSVPGLEAERCLVIITL